MKLADRRKRRRFLARMFGATAATTLAGCNQLSLTSWAPKVLDSAEKLSQGAANLFARKAMAQEFSPADLSPTFRSNGTREPNSDAYRQLAGGGFAAYRLQVGGLVDIPTEFSLDQLRALPARTQITRHDCVDGWSAIGKWKGARLAALLQSVKPQPRARFAVFYCADPMERDGTDLYYESVDLDDAYHEQTILAYELNDQPLPVPNGAPVRLRVERQLGYKHAKYVLRIELVESFAKIAGGRGGYWEDQGYQWFAGI